jgi:hypothetical protein
MWTCACKLVMIPEQTHCVICGAAKPTRACNCGRAATGHCRDCPEPLWATCTLFCSKCLGPLCEGCVEEVSEQDLCSTCASVGSKFVSASAGPVESDTRGTGTTVSKKRAAPSAGGGSVQKHAPYEHGRQKSHCKECGGSGICPHGRQKSYCKECGGSGICPHGRRKSQCKECGGSGICPHGRRKSQCKECGGSGICPHGREKRRCKECRAHAARKDDLKAQIDIVRGSLPLAALAC